MKQTYKITCRIAVINDGALTLSQSRNISLYDYFHSVTVTAKNRDIRAENRACNIAFEETRLQADAQGHDYAMKWITSVDGVKTLNDPMCHYDSQYVKAA